MSVVPFFTHEKDTDTLRVVAEPSPLLGPFLSNDTDYINQLGALEASDRSSYVEASIFYSPRAPRASSREDRRADRASPRARQRGRGRSAESSEVSV